MTVTTAVRRTLEVRGVVQGVGFRPFVAGLASDLHLGGSVRNHPAGVTISVEGSPEAVLAFERRLLAEAPPLARIVTLRTRDEKPLAEAAFHIDRSASHLDIEHRERALVPPDTAVCEDCLAELHDPTDRRHRHPFITCTNCGPRLTIITDIPYDRPATTMADFPLCDRCAAEYVDPHDRRHHAQPIACHDCGPTLVARTADGAPIGVGESALLRTQAALRDGLVVAIKGVGGYHLACDATNREAVRRLRERKQRRDKPFALMVADLATAAAVVEVSPAAESALTGPDRPIVVLPCAPEPPLTTTGIAAGAPDRTWTGEVAPGLDELGVMLPYAPVHHLLLTAHPDTGLAAPPVLVMTSGNLSDEPLAFDDEDALRRLGRIADLFLTHDRRIHVPVEDSVVRLEPDGATGQERVVPIRRSRGHAPLPVALPPLGPSAPVVLAVGAEIKNTFCLARQDWAFCSAHLGDLGSLESQRAFARSVDQLLTLHASVPTDLAADLHPGYSTRAWAERRSDATAVPLHLVQHHHAHLAALLAEHGRLGDHVLGLTFDGTGYGCDATVWGGELLVSEGDVRAMERVGHLVPFVLPGGEIAVRRPARIAVALLHRAGLADRAADLLPGAAPADLAVAVRQLATGGQPMTTSVGRLWDGLAALLGVRAVVTYEAQAAIELEVLARRATAGYAVRLPARPVPGAPWHLDVDVLVRDVVAALEAGVDRAALARGIHDALVAGAVDLAATIAQDRGITTIGLTGGVFQNRLLATGIRSGLESAGLDVLVHRVVPCNDGGLALGQVAIARALAVTTGEGGR